MLDLTSSMLVVCGEALIDVFVEDGGEDPGSVRLRSVAGGSPFNVAIGLARLGRKVALATHLFDDRLGQALERKLLNEGVNLELVRRTSGATPLAMVEVDCRGVPQYAFHGLEDLCVHPEVPADAYALSKAIHFGSFPIVFERSATPLLNLVSNAGQRLISFDPNVRLSVEPNAGLWRRQIDQFRRKAHLVKVSMEDLAIYGGTGDADRIAESWVEDETQIVVLTKGEHGCTVFSRSSDPIVIAALQTTVVDTVGAGDAFMAGLLYWLHRAGCALKHKLAAMSEEQLRAMARFASCAAALACRRQGPNLPFLSELDALPPSHDRSVAMP